MKKKSHSLKSLPVMILILLLIGFSVVACGSEEEGGGGGEEATSSASSQEESTSGGSSEEEATETEDSSGSETSTEEEATTEEESASQPTATPVPAVELEALTNLNLRKGPGTNYGVVGSLAQGETAKITGKNQDGSWFKIETDSGEAWISGSADLVEVDQSLLSGVPVAEAPPAPRYDSSNPAVQLFLNEIPLVVYHERSYTCASYGGLNNLLDDVKPGHVLGPHSGNFVYQDNNVLFKYTGNGFELLREAPEAGFEEGKTLPFERALELIEKGELVWTGMKGEWPAKGVTGCDPNANP